jgi:hypothetical protein
MAGRSRHYTTTFFMRRGAAAGMSNCPVNPVPNLRYVPQALCRHRIFIRRGAAAGMSI